MAQVTAPGQVSAPKPGENTWLWLIKIITGPLLVILLGIHLAVNHFIGQTGLLTYADVIAYFKNPIIPVMEIIFLATVVTHSLIGLRSILLDLKPSRAVLRVIDWALIVLGLLSIAYGTWLALVIASKSL
jgi:succinate dehydrogenase / fumarate reductase, membrane anchor subunit